MRTIFSHKLRFIVSNLFKLMVMIKTLILTFLFAIVVSCDKPSGPSLNISNDIYITVLNSSGEDLLNPDNPNGIDLNGIKVYYELDGEKTEINRANLDHPRMFAIEEPNSNSENYRILLFLNVEDDSEITITYLDLDTNHSDIFKSLLSRGGFGINDEKIWLNDELICDVNSNPGRCSTTIIFD